MKIFNKYIVGALLMGVTAFSLQSCDLEEYNPSGEGADEVFATEQPKVYELIDNSFLEEKVKRMYKQSYQERLHRFQRSDG